MGAVSSVLATQAESITVAKGQPTWRFLRRTAWSRAGFVLLRRRGRGSTSSELRSQADLISGQGEMKREGGRDIRN